MRLTILTVLVLALSAPPAHSLPSASSKISCRCLQGSESWLVITTLCCTASNWVDSSTPASKFSGDQCIITVPVEGVSLKKEYFGVCCGDSGVQAGMKDIVAVCE
ncbi:hypothetical protein BJ742DRAFT_246225 [Cladochytrium replicatum]|nr:hypothetical protein BJ742DRAFT_246225 [Cladochytrium replicatum]